MKIFQSLPEVRRALEPNQAQVARRLNIPKPSMSQFLNGKQLLSDAHLQALAASLETTSKHLTEVFRNSPGKLMILSGPPALKAPIGTDREDQVEVARWIVDSWDSETFKENVKRAIDSGRNDVARVLLNWMDQREVSSSSAEDDAASLDAEHDEATEEELLRSERKPAAAGPTVRKPGRQPSV